LSRARSTETGQAGFTIIEVLVALAVASVSMVAIGALMAGNARGVRALEGRVAVTQVARIVMATAIPPHAALRPGTLSGDREGYHWRIDVTPPGEGWADGGAGDAPKARWVPEIVRLRIESSGTVLCDISSVRLMPRPAE